MFTRKMNYKAIKLEQRVEIVGDTPEGGVNWRVWPPEIHFQEWATRSLSPNDAYSIYVMISEIMPVKKKWEKDLLTSILGEKIINLMTENRKLSVTVSVECEFYGLSDDEVPF